MRSAVAGLPRTVTYWALCEPNHVGLVAASRHRDRAHRAGQPV